jgi:hypothetical protein
MHAAIFLVTFAGGVLVNDRGTRARAAHTFHQLLETRTLRSRHRVFGVPQVVEVEFR